MKIAGKIIYYIWWAFNWFSVVLSILIIIDLLMNKKAVVNTSYLIGSAIGGVVFLIIQVVRLKQKAQQKEEREHLIKETM